MSLYSIIFSFFLQLLIIAQTSHIGVYGQDLPSIQEEDALCSGVHDILNETEQCNFVKVPGTCEADGFVNYVAVLYCTFQGTIRPLGYAVYVLWFLYLLLATAVTSDRFFAPNLPIICDALHLSEEIAGETLMAFGNGAPDFFTSLLAALTMRDGDPGMLYGTLLGSGVFVTTVVVGTIVLIRPFRTVEVPFLKDIIFYMCAVFCAFATMWDEAIYTWEAAIFIVIYVTYVGTVFFFPVVNKTINAHCGKRPRTMSRSKHHKNVGEVDEVLPPAIKCIPMEAFMEESELRTAVVGSSENAKPPTPHPVLEEISSTAPKDKQQDDDSASTDSEESIVDMPWYKWILKGINPIEMEDWETQSWFGRVLQIVKAPIVFLMLITNPVIDEEKPMFNWNRPLNSLHWVISPIFIITAIKQYEVMISGIFPVIALAPIIGLVAAAAIFFTSENTKRPKYHLLFAFYGFATTIIWIYVLAGEVVDLLQCFGIALSISQSILGVTCLAWGNSLGDFINNIIVAKQGYSKMAISSCFGGMLFNLLLGIGVPLLIVSMKNGGVVHVLPSHVLTVLFGFLGFELISSFIAIPLIQRFYVRRPYGIYLYCCYAACIVCAVLTEVGVISPNIFSYNFGYYAYY